MKQNVHCEITHKDEEEKDEIQDMDAYIAEIVDENSTEENSAEENSAEENNDDPSRIAAIELDYMTNYTVKMLSHILDYYKLSKRKLNKTEMVQIIILFEDDPENKSVIATRRQLWKYMERLRNDEYLSKFILFDGC